MIGYDDKGVKVYESRDGGVALDVEVEHAVAVVSWYARDKDIAQLHALIYALGFGVAILEHRRDTQK